MILERLAVRAFGCLRDPVELAFDERFTLVTGKNEAGKSTLFRALHHALFTPYSSNAQEIRELQTWGTELSPEVTVELRVGDERYQVTKSFLHQQRCVLAEWDGTRFRDVANGDRADERIRAFLLGDRPGRGAAGEEHRGLARLLWAPQGQVALPSIEGTLRQEIEKSLDALSLDEGEGRLHALLSGLYFETWSKNGKSFLKKSRLPDLEAEIERLEAERTKAEAAWRAVEQTSQRLGDVEAELAGLGDERTELQQAIERLEAAAKRVQALKVKLATESAELEKWKGRWESLDQQRKRVIALKAQASEAQEALEKQIQPLLERVGKAQEALGNELKQLETEIAEAEGRVKSARSAWQRARTLTAAKEQDAQIRRLAKRLEDVREVQADQAALNEQLAQMPNPTPAQIKQAQELEGELKRLDGRLESVGLSLEFVAESAQTGRVVHGDGREEPFTVEGAETIRAHAARSLQWHIDGVGRFSVRSGADEVATLEQEREEAKGRLKALLAGFGATSSDDLAEMRETRRDVEQRMKSLKEKLTQLLDEYESADALQSALAELERRLTAVCEDLDVTREALAETEPPGVDEAEATYTEAEDALAELNKGLDDLRADVATLEKETGELKTREATEVEKRRNATREMETILAEYGGETAELDRAMSDAQRQRDACQQKVDAITSELPDEDEDPEVEQAGLKTELQSLEESIGALRENRAQLRQQLETAAAQGTYDELVRIEERLQQTRDEYEHQVRQAKAIKLLKALSDTRQQRVVAQLTEPISKRVSRYFEQVSGNVGRQVRFDESLRPTTMSVEREEGVSTEALSTGAREQLQILSRLALGRYLASKSGRHLFVLDDSLVNTDTVRHRKFLELLEEAQEELQIVLLTCHPEWYRGLEGARRVALGR